MISQEQYERLDRYSYSRAAIYLKCPYLYEMKYVEGLDKIWDPRYLQVGTLVHHGLEFAIRKLCEDGTSSEIFDASDDAIAGKWKEWMDGPLVVALCEEHPEFEEQAKEYLDDALLIAKRVIDRQGIARGRWKTLRDKDGTPLVEYDMKVRLITDLGNVLWVHGRIDWAAEDTETGLRWVIDFKNRKAMQKDEVDETNMQLGMYQAMLGVYYGVPTHGTCTWQIRSVVPARPKLNKPTKKVPKAMSRSVIATDWETYKQALVEEGLDPREYHDMKEKLKSFQQLTFTHRSAFEANGMFQEAANVLELMRDRTGLFVPRAMNTYNCGSCTHRDICMERLRGNDPKPEHFGLVNIRERYAPATQD